MNIFGSTTVLLALVLSSAAVAQEADHQLGEHPAVIIKKRYEQGQPYDYASKFYPHPAWLYLRSEAVPPTNPGDAADGRRQDGGSHLESKRKKRELQTGAAANLPPPN